jgi:hypothetical protein
VTVSFFLVKSVCGPFPKCIHPTTSSDIWVPSLLFIVTLSACIFGRIMKSVSNNTVVSNNPAINNNSTIELQQTSIQPDVFLQRHLDATRRRRENFNLQCAGTQNLIRDIPLRNTTESTDRQSSQIDNYNITRTTTSVEQPTLSLPPAYNDVVRQDSITIITEQQSLLPPSYDDFMRGNYKRDVTSL